MPPNTPPWQREVIAGRIRQLSLRNLPKHFDRIVVNILPQLAIEPAEQLNVVPRGGFGTVCSSFVTLPAVGDPIWLFAAGPPHEAAFRPVALR